MKKVQTTCNYCSLSCNLDFYVENNEIVKVLPTSGYSVNDGFACIKGLNLDKQLTRHKPSPQPRIKKPDGTFEIVSWDDAISSTAKKLLEIKEKYGPESIAALSTAQMPFEEMALFSHLIRGYMKGNCDANTRLCMATSVFAHRGAFGFDAPPYALKDFEISDTIIFIGANPVVAHPAIWNRVKKSGRPERKIVVIDPRKSETAQQADYYYPLKGKSDIKLFYTLANYLIEKGWIDNNYIRSYTDGFSAFKAFVADYKLENVKAETGLEPEQVKELAELIHNGKAVSLWWTMGVNQGYEAVRTAQSIINIALMTGNIGRPGTGPNSLTGQPNAMGSRLLSNQAILPGGGDYDNIIRRAACATAMGVPDWMLPDKPTLTYNVIVEKINAGEIKALWVVHTNPRHSWTNNETFQKAMEKLDLLIVNEIYDDTDTSAACDVFFPVVPALKKEGTFINTERRLSALRPVLEREPYEHSDFEVFLKMGEALGMGELLNKWRTPRDVFNIMRQCTRGMPADFTGVDYDGIVGTKGIQWPFREGETLTDNDRRLFENGVYYTPNMRAKFVFEKPMADPLPVSKEFPYIFNTGRGTVGQWHTQTRTREIDAVQDAVSQNAYCLIHPGLASGLEIGEGDKVEITSINGESAVFEVRLTDTVQEGEIFAPIHYLETNKLTPSVYDPISKEPSYKTTPVNLRKVG
ncbi:MAG: molybdopterin-dependent oxidoreductase [Oscillospiraceae bacterium]|nr:molybdopterin-dependent oxidoreductase [Oscillospiraceae bacterium]